MIIDFVSYKFKLGFQICNGEFCNNTPMIIVFIFVILGCFLLGIIIGYIYVKIKNINTVVI